MPGYTMKRYNWVESADNGPILTMRHIAYSTAGDNWRMDARIIQFIEFSIMSYTRLASH